MFRKYDKETGVTTWYLPTWLDKFFYVAGAIWIAFLLLCFIVGIIEGISEL